jgi:hypothetical protein
MAATIIYAERTTTLADARPDGDDLWVSASDLVAATDWEIKPEGICRDELCVPIVGERLAMLRESGAEPALNLAAFARYMGQAVAHDDATAAWYFGVPSSDAQTRMLTLTAPDFELPDLQGHMHRLLDHRGKKVFLLAWASW